MLFNREPFRPNQPAAVTKRDPAMSFRTKTHSASFTSHIVCAAAVVAVLTFMQAANAITLYWDANSMLAGTGTWDDNITQNWSTTNVVGAPDTKWTPNDGTVDADFGGHDAGVGVGGSGMGGSDGQVTVSGTVNVNSITFEPFLGNYSLYGGAINITSPTNSIVMKTTTSSTARPMIIASPISGTDITVVANAAPGSINSFLTLGAPGVGATNTFTGDLIFGGSFPTGSNGFSQININNPTALPSTATVRMKRNLCQLLFTGAGIAGSTGYTKEFFNNIILNDGVSGRLTQGIGAANDSSMITLSGVISGDANLIFELGNGSGGSTFVLNNHETYTGYTNLNGLAAEVVRLGVADALPIGTTLIENRGTFDMAGFNQQIGGLDGTAVGNGVITNTGGTTSTMTIDGNVTGTYTGIMNTDIALVLASTNTGTLTLNNMIGNTYTGGTTISGGKLVAANDISGQQSATGSGPVAVNNGGTLGGNGGVGDSGGAGTITVASGGHIAPGLASGTTIGTLTAQNALSLNSGSSLDIDLGAPAPGGGTSDRVDMPATYGNFALTVPAAASSIGVNLSDPAGGAAGNGTYILMSFQAGQYTGSSNASQFHTSSLPSSNSLNGATTIAYHLADDSNTIQDGNPNAATRVIVTISGGPNALLWSGAASGTWNTSAGNFDNLGTGATGIAFASNDNVTFDDTGANTDPITIAAGGVQPNIVTINNSVATTYTFSGGDIKGSSVGGGGGLYLSGSGAVTINSNYTAAGPITSNKVGTGTATFSGNITAATSLTVNGGTVTLEGANTYTGENTVNGGMLVVDGTSATFGDGNVTVNAGSAAISAGVANAILDTATLTLAGGGTADMADTGFIDLAAGINEQIGSLVLGTTTFTSGTFGSTSSGAANMMDEYFSGMGIITVVGGLPGDFNSDGKVDAGDYVTWRKNNGTNNALPNDNGLGVPITTAHYNLWRSNFGNPRAPAAAVAFLVPPQFRNRRTCCYSAWGLS